MNKFTNYFALLSFLIVPLLFTACNNDDDEENEEPAPTTTVATFPGGVASYNYSVQVVPGNASIDGKVSGIEGAFVTISQGGQSQVQSTVQGGIAYFEGINPGTVNGSVLYDLSNPDHYRLEFVIDRSDVDTVWAIPNFREKETITGRLDLKSRFSSNFKTSF